MKSPFYSTLLTRSPTSTTVQQMRSNNPTLATKCPSTALWMLTTPPLQQKTFWIWRQTKICSKTSLILVLASDIAAWLSTSLQTHSRTLKLGTRSLHLSCSQLVKLCSEIIPTWVTTLTTKTICEGISTKSKIWACHCAKLEEINATTFVDSKHLKINLQLFNGCHLSLCFVKSIKSLFARIKHSVKHNLNAHSQLVL